MLRIQTRLPESYTTAPADELHSRIAAAKAALGESLFILGHHYQRDEVMRWADARGDSFKLSQLAGARPSARYVVFCGVHFMAESADILTSDDQIVILPDLNAGCSMADMAELAEVEDCWEALADVVDISRVVPITYMNSSAGIKAFVGRNGGAVCTSSNAKAVISWALERGDKIVFLPDEHLGRNTGFQLGYEEGDMRVWNPRLDLGGLQERDCKEATFLLWKGFCSIHQRFTTEHIAKFRQEHPGGIVVVHPECSREVVKAADSVGSTEHIISFVEQAEPGAVIGVGTEIHLVNRLNEETPDKTVLTLDPLVCPCSTMFRIDAAHLAWILEGLVDGKVRNQITVDAETAAEARLALSRMLEIA